MEKCCGCSQCPHQLCLFWKWQGVGLLWTFCGVPALSTGYNGMIHCCNGRTSIIITRGCNGDLIVQHCILRFIKMKINVYSDVLCFGDKNLYAYFFSNNRRTPSIKKLFELRKAVKRWDCLQLGPCLSISKGKEIIIFSYSLRQQ